MQQNPIRPRVARRAAILACSAALLVGTVPAWATAGATTYPSKPITAIVGFSAGGAVDQLARLMSQEISDVLGQPVVVQNKTGAGSNLAAGLVARAPADGYTLFFGSTSQAVSVALYKDISYDLQKDLAPISIFAISPNVLVVPGDSPYKSVAELIQAAKAKPGELTFASAGVGTSMHLSGELFKTMAGIDIMHVPYQGVPAAQVDLAAGRTTMMFEGIYSGMPLIKSGKTKLLAVSTKERSRYVPDTPTVSESGLPGFDVAVWYSVSVPAGTPPEVKEKLNKAVNQALTRPSVKAKLADFGVDENVQTLSEAEAFVDAEVKKWTSVVQYAGIEKM